MSPAHCQQLEAFLDGTLDAEARAVFLAHTTTCATCGPSLHAWATTSQKLAAWAAPFAGDPSAEQLRGLRNKSAARFERPQRASWVTVTAVAAGLLALIAGGVVATGSSASRARPGDDGQWAVKLHEGSKESSGDGLVALGSSEAAREIDIGPDRVEVARAAKVDLLEKSTKRTRLRLSQGRITSKIEPGHVGREFVIESPPFRVTVVGTVFETRREGAAIHVATSAGTVRVERVGGDGSVLDAQLVHAGEVVDWSSESAVAIDARELSAPIEHEAEPAVAPVVNRPKPAPSAKDLSAWRQRAARGQCEQVLAETAKALSGAPNHVGTLRMQADCQRKLGQLDAAVASYRKVISAGGGGAESAEAMLIAASLLQDERGDHSGVLEVTSKIDSLRTAPPEVAGAIRVRRANALRLTGKVKASQQELELIIKRYPGTPAAADAQRLKSASP